jgi:dTDP-4-dehydrorhamnose 3,5-epimerase
MIFTETALQGAYLVGLKKIEDERGFFARGWCQKEFEATGLNPNMVQINIGMSFKKGTLRGMHYQEAPYAEAKLVRCTRGAICDVIIDLRPRSPTHGQWIAINLSADNHQMLYSPEGFAHGYQTLTDDAELYYMTSAFYVPSAARGVRYDDPAFAIQWPLPVSVISKSDRQWPDYQTSCLERAKY